VNSGGPQSQSGRGVIKIQFSRQTFNVESFLRRYQAISWRRNSPYFMELQGHCCVQKSIPLVTILSQMNPGNHHNPYFLHILFNAIFQYQPGNSKWSLQFSFLYSFLVSPMPRPVHPPIILCEEYNSRTSSLCSFLCPPVTFSLLGSE
jgi:hypothetical protein